MLKNTVANQNHYPYLSHCLTQKCKQISLTLPSIVIYLFIYLFIHNMVEGCFMIYEIDVYQLADCKHKPQ